MQSVHFSFKRRSARMAAISNEVPGGSTAQAAAELAPGPLSPPGFPGDAREFTDGATARVVAIVGAGATSPLDGAPWEEVLRHMARRINWIDPGYEMLVFAHPCGAMESLPPGAHLSHDLSAALVQADVLLAVAVTAPESVATVGPCMDAVATAVALDCDAALAQHNRLGGIYVEKIAPPARAAAAVGLWAEGRQCLETMATVSEAWGRRSADDTWFSILVLVNAYVAEVPMLQSLRAKDFATLRAMAANCGPQVVACLADPNCRQALQCLTRCAPTDQVCSYRCIVSYESPQLEAFSLCVLQKHNCMGLDAQIRARPEVAPMAAFRGAPLTHERAEDLFVGWLGERQWSWRVVAGQNAAYDQFPCQYQIFYRGKAKASLWYDPVFQVETLEGKRVWRRRHYRVTRASVPGTFNFSVLDNGVVSKEFWRIVHVAEDLSWALFYYSGAAAAAGQSYTGAVLLTEDGQWPAAGQAAQVGAALERCGIKTWELYRVRNSDCHGAPLGVPADAPPLAPSLATRP